MTQVHASFRPSTSHPGVIRVLCAYVPATGTPVVTRLYLSNRTLPKDVSTFMQQVSIRKAPVLGPYEWIGTFPQIGVHQVQERPVNGATRHWESDHFDSETYFDDMEKGIEALSVDLKRRKELKQRGKHDGHETILHLIRRDGPECCWCGLVTNPELPERHPKRSTVEHVTPTSKGGTRSYRNLRVACRTCNNTRGDRDEHPVHALREKPATQYADPPIMLWETTLPTMEDWEPTIDHNVIVNAAISGKEHKFCSVYVKGGGVQMFYRVKNTGVDAEEQVLSLAQSISSPVTFEGLQGMGFEWVPYMEPHEVQVRLRPAYFMEP